MLRERFREREILATLHTGAEAALRPADALLGRDGAKGCVGDFGLDIVGQARAFTIDFDAMRLELGARRRSRRSRRSRAPRAVAPAIYPEWRRLWGRGAAVELGPKRHALTARLVDFDRGPLASTPRSAM